jgi:hypothetical protein
MRCGEESYIKIQIEISTNRKILQPSVSRPQEEGGLNFDILAEMAFTGGLRCSKIIPIDSSGMECLHNGECNQYILPHG